MGASSFEVFCFGVQMVAYVVVALVRHCVRTEPTSSLGNGLAEISSQTTHQLGLYETIALPIKKKKTNAFFIFLGLTFRWPRSSYGPESGLSQPMDKISGHFC